MTFTWVAMPCKNTKRFNRIRQFAGVICLISITSCNSRVELLPPHGQQFQEIAPDISFNTELVITNGSLLSPLKPENAGGPIASCSIEPQLPSGLIRSAECEISGTPTLITPKASYRVIATNSAGTSETSIDITVNDVPPSIRYTSDLTVTRGTEISRVIPENHGGESVSCASSPTLPAGLSLSDQCEIFGTPTVLLNSALYVITATNSGGSSQAALQIAFNDIPPHITGFSPTSILATRDTPIQSAVPTNDGGAIASCSITPALPAGLSLSQQCVISGTPSAVSPTTSYSVTASNSGGNSIATFTITVNDVPPNISYTSNIIATKGAALSPVSPTNTGGVITSCAATPTLPTGLNLSNQCVISGTPGAVSATTTYSVTATNSGGSSQKTLSITVNDTPPIISFPSAITATKDVAISPITPVNAGGAITGCAIAPSLPAGLTLSSACLISGTPTVLSPTTSYTMTAANSGGSSHTTLQVTIVDTTVPPNISYSPSSIVATKGMPIATLTPTNTGGAIEWCSISPSPPPGVQISARCIISGTPTGLLSTTSHVIRANNSAGYSQVILPITINDRRPTITFTRALIAARSSAITELSPQNDGGAIISCSASPALPTGLTLSNTTCAISGTPTALADLAPHTITATNSGGTASATLTVLVTDHNRWVWLGGSNAFNQVGVYGTPLVPSSTNIPGARQWAAQWKDSHGTLWLFGGYGRDSTGALEALNDLWKFDGTNWTWVSGSDRVQQAGNYGLKGVASSTNVPGAHYEAASWIDASDNLWFFGGYGYDSTPGHWGMINDLWKFDGTNWTWVSGDSQSGQYSTYGQLGVSNPANTPGARFLVASSSNSSPSFWIFGGHGVDNNHVWSVLNDLWKFDGTNWTWVSGSQLISQLGVYGDRNVPLPSNVPGARKLQMLWQTSSNTLWMFGGVGFAKSGGQGWLNDLWKFDGTNWTWISGSDTVNSVGIYGLKGTPSSSNIPGPRLGAALWQDAQGNLFLLGGFGKDAASANNYLNDLWKFDGTNWTWLTGSDLNSQTGAYGRLGGSDNTDNISPGARAGGASWTDENGNLFLFGGFVNTGVFFNDFWVYVP